MKSNKTSANQSVKDLMARVVGPGVIGLNHIDEKKSNEESNSLSQKNLPAQTQTGYTTTYSELTLLLMRVHAKKPI